MGNASTRPKGKYLNEIISKCTNLETDDAFQIFKDFQRQSGGKGKLSEDDFVTVYIEAFNGKSEISALARNIFHAFDTNHNGFVEFEEFVVGLSVTEACLVEADQEMRIKKMKWAFDVYDKDRSNTIDRHEMRLIAVADVVELFLGDETPDEFADRLFEEADVNKDGKITFEEFQKAAEHNDTLVNMLLPAPV
ncbi:hippocalcin-like protein 1 isoform X4 [Dreissena polymorpha]|uniref:hippocalcin-like protein 1 isoform X4 n=1 Tax=Dreissena polymorpha TaxID=45954 RepID=UPI0022654289|nr:hippocalcin-like protein 1 isoform X4 [Dreissena polymorpha]